MRPFRSRRPSLTEDAHTTADRLIRQKAAAYDRDRDLPGLLPELFWHDEAKAAAPSIRAALAKALARERRLGARRHRGYSLSRHIALAVAYQAETGAPVDAVMPSPSAQQDRAGRRRGKT